MSKPKPKDKKNEAGSLYSFTYSQPLEIALIKEEISSLNNIHYSQVTIKTREIVFYF